MYKVKIRNKQKAIEELWVSLLVEIMLNDNEATQSALSRTSLFVKWKIPVCVTGTKLPFGKLRRNLGVN